MGEGKKTKITYLHKKKIDLMRNNTNPACTHKVEEEI
jgi:hypothetical protein